MDPRYSGELLKHLEKQNELLVNAYDSMSQELHQLLVEEEMLMRKCYDLAVAQGLTKTNEGHHRKNEQETGLLTDTSNGSDCNHIGHSTALVTTETRMKEHTDSDQQK